MRKIIGLSLALALLLGVQATGNNHIKNKLAQTKSEVSLKSQAEVQSLADASCPSCGCKCDLDLEDLDLIVNGGGVAGIPGDGVGTLAESHQNTQVLSSLQASIVPDTTYVQESESLACSTGSSCGK